MRLAERFAHTFHIVRCKKVTVKVLQYFHSNLSFVLWKRRQKRKMNGDARRLETDVRNKIWLPVRLRDSRRMARLSALIRQLIFQYILHFNTVLKPPEHF